MKNKKLGRGLGSLLSEADKQAEAVPVIFPHPTSIPSKPPSAKKTATYAKPLVSQIPPLIKGQNLIYIKTADLIPNRFQPRKTFARESLDELITSIKSTGVLQPILVRQSGNKYELVAGERRWRACQSLKMEKIPAIIKEKVNDREMLEWALIENTQRKDLNPIEKARGYKELMNTFKLTQERVAERVGLDRSTVANFIRLLDLPAEIQDDVSRETVSPGHARAILALDTKADQLKLVRRIKREGLSVRRLENIISRLNRPSKPQKPADKGDLYLKELEDRLRRHFGTKVAITHRKQRGYINIEFYSNNDFQRIIELLTKTR